MKAYRQRPENKTRAKAYSQRAEVKAHQKVRDKVYNQRPEVKAYKKAYQKAYYQRPEVKAHQKAYRKAYSQRPEVKKRVNVYAREYNRCRREDPAVIISDSRKQYEQLCDKDPKEARELLTELEQTEGKVFRELLLDGIPEKKLGARSGGV